MTQTMTKVVADFNTTLSLKVAIGDTTATLSSATDDDGVALPTGTYGLTIDRKNASKEFIQCTITGTAVTAVYSVSRQGVKTSGFSRTHRKGSEVIISDWSALKRINDIIDGTVNLDSGTPLTYDGVVTLTPGSNQISTVKYADDLAIAGSPDATTTTKGIGKVSVAPVSATSPIFVGDNDGRVPTQDENNALVGNNTDIAVGTGNKFITQTGLQHNAEKYAADSGSTDTYVITLSPAPTSYTNGMVVYFKANTVNTGAATINVNGLGAKTIIKGVSTTLSDGDIPALSLNTLIYDGTNFVLQNPVATVSSPTGTSGVSTGPASSSTQTITHSLGRTPTTIRLQGIGAFTGGSTAACYSSSHGVYNSSGNRCVYIGGISGGVGGSTTPATSTTFSIYLDALIANNATGVVGNITSTTFDIVWTNTANVSGTQFIWEAQ